MAGPYESLLRDSNWSSIISLKTGSKVVSCSLISEGWALLLKGTQALPICHCVKINFEGKVDCGTFVKLYCRENRSTWRDTCPIAIWSTTDNICTCSGTNSELSSKLYIIIIILFHKELSLCPL